MSPRRSPTRANRYLIGKVPAIYSHTNPFRLPVSLGEASERRKGRISYMYLSRERGEAPFLTSGSARLKGRPSSIAGRSSITGASGAR